MQDQKQAQLQKLENIKGLIFDTPLLELAIKDLDNKIYTIYAKYEAKNLSGSIKDRMAFYMLREAYKNGKLAIGQEIVEMTSGNAGIALTALSSLLGHKITIVMPDWLSQERYNSIALYGANLIKISKEDGGFLRSLEVAREIEEKNNAYYPDQFSNPCNTLAHKETTAPEILKQLKALHKIPQHFIAGMGTGGTIMGCNEYFQSISENHTICYALEPANSPILTNKGKKAGSHRIQGIVDDFIPALMDLEKIKNIISVDDEEAIAMAKKLSSHGVGVGISSGANLMGALEIAKQHPNDTVVTVFADNFFRYFSTDMVKPAKKDKLKSDKYTIESIKVHKIK